MVLFDVMCALLDIFVQHLYVDVINCPKFDDQPGLEQIKRILSRVHYQQIGCNVFRDTASTMKVETDEVRQMGMGMCVDRKVDCYLARFSENDIHLLGKAVANQRASSGVYQHHTLQDSHHLKNYHPHD